MPEDRLERLLNEMRNEDATAEQVAEAKRRVWDRLAEAAPALCAGFREAFPDYLEGRLAEARRLLVDDHLGRCAACRRVLAEAKGERKVTVMPGGSRWTLPRWSRWAVAAGLALVAVYAGRGRIDAMLAPSGPRATVELVNGSLYRLSTGPVSAGWTLGEGEVVRTGPGARAVLRLADGTAVEMNERTEVSLHAAWSGRAVKLDRGDVMIEAAQQRRRTLRVVTRDAVASVKGTMFAVSTGSAGSLVTVVEGAVSVEQPGGARLLKPGQQWATTPALSAVPSREAVGWSQSAEKYYTLLAELSSLEQQLAETVSPAVRTEPRLLRYLPAQPLIYGAIPNLGGTIGQALNLIERRSRESDVLREWWTSPQADELKRMLERLQIVSPMLGEEIVFMLAKDASGGQKAVPLLLAEVQPGRRESLQQVLADLLGGAQGAYRVTESLLTVSDSADHLARLTAQFGQGVSGAFAAEIAKKYERGASWLFGVDVTAMEWGAAGSEAAALGLSQMKHLFFEQRQVQGQDENETTLTFQGARTGIPSWLAAPASAGSAVYVSSDAVLVVSAATRNPKQAFDELAAMLGRVTPKFPEELRQFEEKTGISVSNDVAAALGTDFTLAIERPSLPVPGWIAVAEVYQPGLLDDTMRRLVEAFNRELDAERAQYRLDLEQQESDGRVWMTLKSAASPVALHWTYDRGYLVASSDRALVSRAIATRDGGFPLIWSARFRQLVPATGGVHQSGFVWLNTQGALADLAGLVPSGSLRTLMENRNPVLIVLNGEMERIRAASRTRLTSLVLDLMMAGGTAIESGGAERRKIGTHAARN